MPIDYYAYPGDGQKPQRGGLVEYRHADKGGADARNVDYERQSRFGEGISNLSVRELVGSRRRPEHLRIRPCDDMFLNIRRVFPKIFGTWKKSAPFSRLSDENAGKRFGRCFF